MLTGLASLPWALQVIASPGGDLQWVSGEGQPSKSRSAGRPSPPQARSHRPPPTLDAINHDNQLAHQDGPTRVLPGRSEGYVELPRILSVATGRGEAHYCDPLTAVRVIGLRSGLPRVMLLL